MENASKALIIAASVLVAILIISMGVAIFNRAQNAASTEELDQTEITMFNSKFEKYSNIQNGSQAKSLVSFAVSNASTNKDDQIKLPTIYLNNVKDSTSHTYTAVGGTTASNDIGTYTSTLGSMRKEIVSTASYDVTCTYGESGLIHEITIQRK